LPFDAKCHGVAGPVEATTRSPEFSALVKRTAKRQPTATLETATTAISRRRCRRPREGKMRPPSAITAVLRTPAHAASAKGMRPAGPRAVRVPGFALASPAPAS
jgi:hypothetical protein